MAMAVALGGAAVSMGACRDAAPPAGATGEEAQPLTIDIDAGAPKAAPADAGMALSPPRPVYGPPAALPGDRIPGLRGKVSIAPVTASVPVPNADREMALAQPVLRDCYQRGLRRDPTQAGTLNISLSVQPDGKVSAVSVDGPVDDEVRTCMKARLMLNTFGAIGAASTLTTRITCTSTHD